LSDRKFFKRYNIFAEAFNSTSKEKSPRPRDENLIWQLYTYDGPQNPALRSLYFPLTAIISIAGREKKKLAQKVIKQRLSDYAHQD
jgi:hypothetical protein